MRIGYISLTGRGATDACLAEAVRELRRQDLRLAGTVQTNLARAKTHPCDMDLQVLPDGPVLRISQDLGAKARGCRLDGHVLEQAVVEAGLRLEGAALLVVNKWGKLEGQGRGYVPLISRALELGIPVLVGVNGLNLPAFLAFADGLAEDLPATPEAIAQWVKGGLAAGQAA